VLPPAPMPVTVAPSLPLPVESKHDDPIEDLFDQLQIMASSEKGQALLTKVIDKGLSGARRSIASLEVDIWAMEQRTDALEECLASTIRSPKEVAPDDEEFLEEFARLKLRRAANKGGKWNTPEVRKKRIADVDRFDGEAKKKIAALMAARTAVHTVFAHKAAAGRNRGGG